MHTGGDRSHAGTRLRGSRAGLPGRDRAPCGGGKVPRTWLIFKKSPGPCRQPGGQLWPSGRGNSPVPPTRRPRQVGRTSSVAAVSCALASNLPHPRDGDLLAGGAPATRRASVSSSQERARGPPGQQPGPLAVNSVHRKLATSAERGRPAVLPRRQHPSSSYVFTKRVTSFKNNPCTQPDPPPIKHRRKVVFC